MMQLHHFLIVATLAGCNQVSALDISPESCPEVEPKERVLLRELVDLPAEGSPRQLAVVCPPDTQLVTGGCIGGSGVHVFFSVPEAIQDGQEPTEVEPNGWACGGETSDGHSHVMAAQVVCEYLD